MSAPPPGPAVLQRPGAARRWGVPMLLYVLTIASTLWVGSQMVLEREPASIQELLAGWVFALPLMAILTAHELGHYITGRLHGVDISPPYFIPMPFILLGTMGAVIRMRGAIRSRNALLDVGASGPLAGMALALPILIYGIHTSPVLPLPEGNYFVEGRSVLYLAVLWALKGNIAPGQDVFLTPTALAGWAGLLVTMINLLPVGQLDGGHVAYALFGPRQDAYSERIRRFLPLVAVAVCAIYGLPAYLMGVRGDALIGDATAGAPWLVWAGFLWLMTRLAGRQHPPTGPEPLSPRRRAVALFTLLLFVLLFMPTWMRMQ